MNEGLGKEDGGAGNWAGKCKRGDKRAAIEPRYTNEVVGKRQETGGKGKRRVTTTGNGKKEKTKQPRPTRLLPHNLAPPVWTLLRLPGCTIIPPCGHYQCLLPPPSNQATDCLPFIGGKQESRPGLEVDTKTHEEGTIRTRVFFVKKEAQPTQHAARA